MNSQETAPAETPAASSSRGAAIPLEATTGGTGNQLPEDVSIPLSKPAGDFQLRIFEDIDLDGDYNVPIPAAAQHDLPRPQNPGPANQASVLTNEILNQFFEAQFQRFDQRLDRVHATCHEDELEDYMNNITDDDEEEDEDVVTALPAGTSVDYIYTIAPMNDELPQLPAGNNNIDIVTTTAPVPVPKLTVPGIELRMEPMSKSIRFHSKRAAVEEDEQGTGVPGNDLHQNSSQPKRLAVEKQVPHEDGSSSSDKSISRSS